MSRYLKAFALGLALFVFAVPSLYQSRGELALGGEVFFLLFPLFLWMYDLARMSRSDDGSL